MTNDIRAGHEARISYAAATRFALSALALMAFLVACSSSPHDSGENAKAVSQQVTAAPDLVVTAITVSPAGVAPSQPATFSATVKNQGTVATPAGTIIGVAFAVDGTTVNWSDTDTQSLAPGQSITLTANSGPSGVSTWTAASGNYTLRAWVDDVNRIVETDETNNQLSVPLNIASDLIVTSVTASPTSVAPGQPVTFSATVKNQGTNATPPGTIIGVAFAVDGTTVNWSDTDTQSLAPGQSVTLTANGGPNSGASTWSASAGAHTVRAWVDDVNRILESNETNNQLSVPLSIGIDLTVTAVAPATPVIGSPTTFSAVVTNVGTSATPSGVIIGVAFAVDGATVSWSDTDTQSLQPGQSVTLVANNGPTGSSTWTATSGTHTLQAWVDDVNRMNDVNRDNNKLTTSFTSQTGQSGGGGAGGASGGTSSSSVFGAAVGYNVFVFQDLSVTPTIAGPVAAGRDVSAQTFGYNTSAAGSIGAVVGRNFTGANGSVQRDLVYGNALSLSNVGVLQGTSRQGTPIDFVAEEATLDLLSANLAKFTTNGTTAVSQDGTTIDFTGTDATRNVFGVAGSSLGASHVLRFFAPSSSTVVVNVTGTAAVFQNTGMQLGGLPPGHLVWNFPQASTVRLAQMGFEGTLLAVNATVTQSSSTLDGVLIATSLTGGDNGLTWQPFNGDPGAISTRASVPASSIPRALPAPPAQVGCYVGTQNGWVTVPCSDGPAVEDQFGKPDVDQGLASVAVGAAPAASLQFAQIETTIVDMQSEKDVIDPVRKQNLGCGPGGDPSGFIDVSDEWSVQNNTNFFSCDQSGPNPNGAYDCAVQFTIQTKGTPVTPSGSGATGVCIWNINAGHGTCDGNIADQNYNKRCVGDGPQFLPSRPGPLRPFDYANVAGYAFSVNGVPKLGLVTQFTWASTATSDAVNQIPGLYAIVTDDTFGLAGHWTAVTGAVLGMGGGGMASFQSAGIVTRVAASSCITDTTVNGAVCPGQPALAPNAVSTDNQITVEQNNLSLVSGSAAIGFPNADMAVTEFLGSTNTDGSCWTDTNSGTLANHVYVKDNDGDNAGIPSNSGGMPFWESPDLFVVPAGAPAPALDAVSAEWSITAGQAYDVYVRVNNDGCNDVGGLKALIYLADPDVGLSLWQPVTTGYRADPNPAHAHVSPFSRQMLGPYNWPGSADGKGHKCLLAAIQADSEMGPSSPLPLAYTSNQVAQRNLQFSDSSCQYNITNGTSNTAFLQLGVSVTPATPAPPIALTFTDSTPGSTTLATWASTWRAQGAPLVVATSQDSAGHTVLNVTMTNTSQIGLAAVALPGGEAPAIKITEDLVPGSSQKISLSATLTDIDGHVLAQNGGSCAVSVAEVK